MGHKKNHTDSELPIRFETEESSIIDDNQIVKVTKYNARPLADVMLVKGSVNDNLKIYERINKDEYLNKETGERLQYAHNNFKTEKSSKRSMKQLEKILLNNFSGADNELFVTLTTAEAVTDVYEMRRYFKLFWDRLKKEYDDLEYAYVYEMQQARESLHIHLMLKAVSHKHLYISNAKITEYWAQGQTRTVKVTNKSTAFEIDEEKAMSQPDGFLAKQNQYGIDRVISYLCKYHTKEGILNGVRLYSTSRNIKIPESTTMLYDEFRENFNKDNSRIINTYTTKIISNKTDATLNMIQKERWIKK